MAAEHGDERVEITSLHVRFVSESIDLPARGPAVTAVNETGEVYDWLPQSSNHVMTVGETEMRQTSVPLELRPQQTPLLKQTCQSNLSHRRQGLLHQQPVFRRQAFFQSGPQKSGKRKQMPLEFWCDLSRRRSPFSALATATWRRISHGYVASRLRYSSSIPDEPGKSPVTIRPYPLISQQSDRSSSAHSTGSMLVGPGEQARRCIISKVSPREIPATSETDHVVMFC